MQHLNENATCFKVLFFETIFSHCKLKNRELCVCLQSAKLLFSHCWYPVVLAMPSVRDRLKRKKGYLF